MIFPVPALTLTMAAEDLRFPKPQAFPLLSSLAYRSFWGRVLRKSNRLIRSNFVKSLGFMEPGLLVASVVLSISSANLLK